MDALAFFRLPVSPRIVVAAVLTASCASALANSGLDRARQRGKLVGGIHYVVPEYKGGMKYRTPEALDNTLLEDVAKRLQLPLSSLKAERGTTAALLSDRSADLALAMVLDPNRADKGSVLIPTGYAAGPMAIMRSDTDIKSWQQLKGRKVCVSEGGLYVGTLAAKYGAIEKAYRAPADALIAVRVGECDAAVHDNTLLEELIKYPEWKKFSARLPVEQRAKQVFVVREDDRQSAAFLKQVVADWAAKGQLDKLVKNAVRNIAFEVYLDQDVPDCH